MYVALDIQNDTAYAAVADRRPTGAALITAKKLAWPEDAVHQAAALQSALPEVRWSKASLIVTVGGDRVGYRLLKLPPVPDEELPDMVRLLAEREFGAAPGDGAIDYVPLSDDPNAQRTVLAARIKQRVIDQSHALADGLGATLEGIVLRGAATASMAGRIEASVQTGSSLVIAPAGEEIDLVVLDAGRPALLRTTRANESGELPASELRRTLSAIALQLGHPVERVVTFKPLEPAKPEKLQATSVDPQSMLTEQYRLPAADQSAAEQAIASVAAAVNAAERTTPSINFLSPRKATQSGAANRNFGLVGGAVAAALLACGWQMYSSIAGYNNDAASFTTKRNAAEKRIEKLQPYQSKVDAIEAWRESDVNWLDELHRLSVKVRPKTLDAKDYESDSDVMLTQFTANVKSSREGAGGVISFDVAAKEVAAAGPLEARLRDVKHNVEQQSVEQAAGGGPYAWRFRSTMEVPSSPELEKFVEDETEPSQPEPKRETTEAGDSQETEPADSESKDSENTKAESDPATAKSADKPPVEARQLEAPAPESHSEPTSPNTSDTPKTEEPA